MMTVVVLACSLLLQSFPTTEAMSLSPPYNLMGVPPAKKPEADINSNTKGDQQTEEAEEQDRITSSTLAVTNSPIYYINKLDLSSLLMNLLPLQNQPNKKQKRPPLRGGQQRPTLTTTPLPPTLPPQTPNPFFEALVASVLANHKNQMHKQQQQDAVAATTPTPTTTTTTTTPYPRSTVKPFKRITLPFISNARPVASYQLKPISNSQEPSEEQDMSTKPSVLSIDTITDATIGATQGPITTTMPSYLKKYTPSKIIRLKTKFVSNGQPSAVYVHKSPARRYFLQDLLRRKPSETHLHHGNSFRMYKRKNPFYREAQQQNH